MQRHLTVGRTAPRSLFVLSPPPPPTPPPLRTQRITRRAFQISLQPDYIAIKGLFKTGKPWHVLNWGSRTRILAMAQRRSYP